MSFSNAQAMILTIILTFIRPMTIRHHLVTVTDGKSLAKMNQRTNFALITFLVWILFFHSTSCYAFV
jgi:hypothetical protein